jgi:hypothetical protein
LNINNNTHINYSAEVPTEVAECDRESNKNGRVVYKTRERRVKERNCPYDWGNISNMQSIHGIGRT